MQQSTSTSDTPINIEDLNTSTAFVNEGGQSDLDGVGNDKGLGEVIKHRKCTFEILNSESNSPPTKLAKKRCALPSTRTSAPQSKQGVVHIPESDDKDNETPPCSYTFKTIMCSY